MVGKTIKYTAAAAILSLAGYGVYLIAKPGSPQPKAIAIDSRTSEAKEAEKDLREIAKTHGTAPEQSKQELKEFVEENKAKEDKDIQDQVGNAQIRLAYLEAKEGDFKAAREELKQASEVKGTGKINPDFGGVPDQAAYQAAVCLVAEGKNEEAIKELVQFIKDWPLSPLVQAARNRLIKMDEKNADEYDALLEAAQAKQTEKIQFETSVCGPKAIEYVLPLLGKEKKGYEELAKLCGTTETGTTVEGLMKGLEKVGVKSYAYKLNRADMARVKLPAIVLSLDHYNVLLHVEKDRALVYDPRNNSEFYTPIPPEGDTKYSISALIFTPLQDN